MTYLPVRREIRTRRNPAALQVKAPKTVYHWLVATITNPDLISVVAFCVIGLLVTANVVLRFPDFGLMVEQLEQFP